MEATKMDTTLEQASVIAPSKFEILPTSAAASPETESTTEGDAEKVVTDVAGQQPPANRSTHVAASCNRSMTPKQQRFVEEYLIDLNATQAAIRAGYSAETARSIGSENLTKPDIQEAIATAMDERSKRTEITQDYVLQGICRIVERTAQRQPSIALRGYELLGKHLKCWTDKLEIEGDLSKLSDEELEGHLTEKLHSLGFHVERRQG
jgi:phage terminase small subunit